MLPPRPLVVNHPRGLWPILIGVAVGTLAVTALTSMLLAWRVDRRAQLRLEAGISEITLRRVEVVEEEGEDDGGESEEHGRGRDEEAHRVMAAARLHNRNSEGIQLQDLRGESSLDGAARRA